MDTSTSTMDFSNGRTIIIDRTDGLLTELTSIVQIGIGFDPGAVFVSESTIVFDPVTGLPSDGFFDESAPWTDVQVRQDDGDRRWDRIETRRDAEGEVVFRETLRDDGLNTRFVSSGFGDSVTMHADSGDVRNWSFRYIFENEEGGQRGVVTVFDDDRIRSDAFDASGQLTLREDLDVGDAYAWSERLIQWDEDGNRDFMRVVRDDGRVIEKDYEAGVLRNVFIEDREDVFNWAAIERVYDETGTLVSEVRFPDIDPADLPPPNPWDNAWGDELRDSHEQLVTGQEPLGLQPPSDEYSAFL